MSPWWKVPSRTSKCQSSPYFDSYASASAWSLASSVMRLASPSDHEVEALAQPVGPCRQDDVGICEVPAHDLHESGDVRDPVRGGEQRCLQRARRLPGRDQGLGRAGRLRGARDPSNSSTVRVRDGVPAVTDDPYVEAKDFLARYYVVECETAERAGELAAQIPDAQYTAIEVRPVMDGGGLEM